MYACILDFLYLCGRKDDVKVKIKLAKLNCLKLNRKISLDWIDE